VDAEAAIADLLEISSQLDAAVLVGADGSPVASSLPPERAERLARAADALLGAAEAHADGRELTEVEAATRTGSVFLVRDGARTLAATTGPLPTAGLVLYDLRTCLRSLAEPEPAKPKRRRKQPKGDGARA
jgi:predicted regulator of Ras-like GTPase activity (Roadblock/LC7/MglB family)